MNLEIIPEGKTLWVSSKAQTALDKEFLLVREEGRSAFILAQVNYITANTAAQIIGAKTYIRTKWMC